MLSFFIGVYLPRVGRPLPWPPFAKARALNRANLPTLQTPSAHGRDAVAPLPRCPSQSSGLRFPFEYCYLFLPPATRGRHPPPENRTTYVVTRSRPYPYQVLAVSGWRLGTQRHRLPLIHSALHSVLNAVLHSALRFYLPPPLPLFLTLFAPRFFLSANR